VFALASLHDRDSGKKEVKQIINKQNDNKNKKTPRSRN
jgi:hypothetical protein